MLRITGIFFLLALIAGCASSHVLVGKVRPEIPPSEVKLYLIPPPKFEEVALLEASSKSSWAITDQGKMNKAIERLKEEAAKLGANGVLINSSGEQHGGAVTTVTPSGSNVGFGMAAIHKFASGMAIFVGHE